MPRYPKYPTAVGHPRPHRRALAPLALAAALLGAACNGDSTGPTDPATATHPELRGTAILVTVDVRNGTMTLDAPAARAAAVATRSGLGPRFALLGENELSATLSNFFRSEVGAFVARKVRVRFDVALTNRLRGAILVTPTFPRPPLGQTGVLLIPFDVTQIIGGGTVTASTDWDGNGTTGSGAPYDFFNDFNGCSRFSETDCYRWETFAESLSAGATSAVHTVGFDVDPTVQSFQVYMMLAADLKDDFPPQVGAVSGTVTSPQRGALAGVTVTESGGARAVTDASGAYRLTGLPLGGTILTLSNLPADCIAPALQGAMLTAGGIADVSFSVACAERRLIAFVSSRNGDYEIFTMSPDGTAITQITNTDGQNVQPAWSPDGTKIAFTSTRDGNSDVYVMDADGSNVTRLTDWRGSDGEPSWSPDGTKIAFTSDRDGDGEIYVMNADGTNVTRLTNSPGYDLSPAWSPDGSKIAFTSSRDHDDEEIYVMNADGSNVTRLTNSAGEDRQPSWSPDGTRIAFTSYRDSNGEIYVMNADGTNVTRLTTNVVDDDDPCWSPDGTRIVFASNRAGYLDFDILVMNADGTGQRNITNRPGTNESSPAW